MRISDWSSDVCSSDLARGLEEVAALPDPVGRTIAEWERPNGLRIVRITVPLGVIGIIYESRPHVTADAGGLCLQSGHAAILRGGSESLNSSGVAIGRASWRERGGQDGENSGVA